MPTLRPGVALPWCLAVWFVLLALAACETTPTPILRGSGSEHRQAIRVGLPF